MSDEETIIEKPPSRRSILVFKKTLSEEMVVRIGQTLTEAMEKDGWPLVMSGVGPVSWYSIDALPQEHPVEKIRVYRDRADEWRWRAFARNHKIVADSGEGYHNFDDCADMAERLFPGIPVDMRKYLYIEVNEK